MLPWLLGAPYITPTSWHQDFSIVFVSAAPSTMLKLIFNTSFYKCSHLSMLVACGTWRLMASLRPMKASFANHALA